MFYRPQGNQTQYVVVSYTECKHILFTRRLHRAAIIFLVFFPKLFSILQCVCCCSCNYFFPSQSFFFPDLLRLQLLSVTEIIFDHLHPGLSLVVLIIQPQGTPYTSNQSYL